MAHIAECLLLVLAPALVANAQVPLPATAARCVVTDQGRKPVLLPGGGRVFVEPEAVARAGSRILVAGSPSYLWQATDTGFAFAGRDTVLGIVIDSTGSASLVHAPISAKRVFTVRATAYGLDKWAVVFTEAPPLKRYPQDPEVAAYWFGVTDGSRWHHLEKLPGVSGKLRTQAASSLVNSGRGFAIATPVQTSNGEDVAVFVQDGGRWSVTVIPTRVANYVALAADTGGWTLGAVYPDVAAVGDGNTFWMHRRARGDTAWQQPTLLIPGRVEAVHHPQLASSSRGLVMAWHARTEDGQFEARVGMSTAMTSFDHVSPLVRASEQILLVVGIIGQPMWITLDYGPERVAPPSVRIWMATKGKATQVAAARIPFDGVIGAASVDKALVLVGPVRGAPGQHPAVSLHIQRFAVTCD